MKIVRSDVNLRQPISIHGSDVGMAWRYNGISYLRGDGMSAGYMVVLFMRLFLCSYLAHGGVKTPSYILTL